MLRFVRSLSDTRDLMVGLPSLVAALAIAELFYHFKSFTLEAVAFLATWLVIDLAIDAVARLTGHWNK